MFKNVFKFLGAEANARAITSVALIASLLGAIIMFFATQILPLYSPSLKNDSFGKGYRLGKREALLEFQNSRLKASLQAQQEMNKIQKEIRNMTDEQVNAELKKWSRN